MVTCSRPYIFETFLVRMQHCFVCCCFNCSKDLQLPHESMHWRTTMCFRLFTPNISNRVASGKRVCGVHHYRRMLRHPRLSRHRRYHRHYAPVSYSRLSSQPSGESGSNDGLVDEILAKRELTPSIRPSEANIHISRCHLLYIVWICECQVAWYMMGLK